MGHAGAPAALTFSFVGPRTRSLAPMFQETIGARMTPGHT